MTEQERMKQGYVWQDDDEKMCIRDRNSNLDCFVRKSFQRWNGFYCGLSFLQIA